VKPVREFRNDDSEVWSPASMPKGTVIAIGNPNNERLAVKLSSERNYEYRYLHNGFMIDPEDLKAGWGVYVPGSPSENADEDLVPRHIGHPDNEPATSRTVLAAYASLVRGIWRLNAAVPEPLRIAVPFAVQEAISAYVGEREAIESIWSQEQEDKYGNC
jgi:hypothetical protein